MAEYLEIGCGCAAEAGDVRVLQRLDLRTGPTDDGEVPGVSVGIALDVETTGLDAERDPIIELAMRRFRFDAAGVITDIDEPWHWLEDPGRDLDPDIARLTGLADADLAGRSIDEGAAIRLLRSANVVIAHHSRFDRVRVERRLPDACGLDWACSMEEIDWRGRGLDGRSLGYLLMQVGFYHEGHRAGTDVDALIQLLRHRFDDGRTALSLMMERSAQDSWLVQARGAAFDLKDELRARGYRWDARARTWWREVPDVERIREEFWLAANVYGSGLGARALGPDFERVTAATRFG